MFLISQWLTGSPRLSRGYLGTTRHTISMTYARGRHVAPYRRLISPIVDKRGLTNLGIPDAQHDSSYSEIPNCRGVPQTPRGATNILRLPMECHVAPWNGAEYVGDRGEVEKRQTGTAKIASINGVQPPKYKDPGILALSPEPGALHVPTEYCGPLKVLDHLRQDAMTMMVDTGRNGPACQKNRGHTEPQRKIIPER